MLISIAVTDSHPLWIRQINHWPRVTMRSHPRCFAKKKKKSQVVRHPLEVATQRSCPHCLPLELTLVTIGLMCPIRFNLPHSYFGHWLFRHQTTDQELFIDIIKKTILITNSRESLTAKGKGQFTTRKRS
ncbi:tubulin beta-2 chain [Platysternon megacephalum]|uniref:Tubulin beta-2 chain n=1 Tax=Platysternon megacephalum TaxID=55544 RepID=A0A4D9EI04_9SAUR|nr:tubulin beta-2 chain [Platysternon megacephalum]